MVASKKKPVTPKKGEQSTDLMPILKSVFEIATVGLAFYSLFKNKGRVTIPEKTEDFTFTPSPPSVG